MAQIDLKHGRGVITLDYDAGKARILGATPATRPLSDAEIGIKLDHPNDSISLEETVNAGETVLLVVPDATREVGCGQVVNLVVRRLIANGTPAHNIRIIFATGIHRKVTAEEKDAILTPFIAQRIKTLDHDPRDLSQIMRLGETAGGINVELNRALLEHDHIILVGGAAFHYFAGFTGGRKLICPGLASSRTVSATHKLAFDCETHSRREGVGTGRLDGNAVHEAFMEAAARVPPAFAVTTIVNDDGEIVDLYCGDWVSSHRAACDAYAEQHTVEIGEKRDLVIASCGGYPHDINLIQAHKSLEAASHACNEGGTIVLLAECSDGLGRDDFTKWFAVAGSRELGELLCSKYQVNGQTAWSLLRKAERFDVRVVTAMPEETVRLMKLKKTNTTNTDVVSELLRTAVSSYILPAGARCLIKASDAKP